MPGLWAYSLFAVCNCVYIFSDAEKEALAQNIQENLIPGYTEQQLTANRTFRFGKCQLRLQAEIVNLCDKTYDVIRYYPMPGRSFRTSVQVSY